MKKEKLLFGLLIILLLSGCRSGDYKYVVQVKEYHQICWERDV